MQLATSAGAQVVFGDINQAGGQKVAQETGATFVHTDISKYSDQIGLFEAALQKHGRVDYAIANAALYEPKVTFDPGLSLEDIKQVSARRANSGRFLPSTLELTAHSIRTGAACANVRVQCRIRDQVRVYCRCLSPNRQ